LYYRLPVFLATIALAIYALLSLAAFELVPVTLTLAGLAGFILSIGMAVDANILIFERMKEERAAGKPLNLAIDQGFKRAWSSIFDSNMSSLITAAILYYTATGLVRGFALTLAIGILMSMFTAITVTKTFLRLVLRPAPIKELV
jgi:protein-export membrane protein SecD